MATLNQFRTRSTNLFVPITAAAAWFVLSTAFVATTILAPAFLAIG